MKVTIEGNFDQVVSFLEAPTLFEGPAPLPLTGRARNGESWVAKKNAVMREQADILRRAFALVRYDPDEKELAETFLAALVGRSDRTEAILEKANEIILSRQAPPSSSEPSK